MLLAVLLLASLVLVTIDYRSEGDGPLTKLGNGVSAILGPLQDAIAKITRPIGNFFSGFGQVGSLKTRIRELESELATLQQDQGRVLSTLTENEQLRSLLAMRDRLRLDTKAADVIGRDPSNFQEALVINIGTREGIRKDMAVIAGEGLVGKVVQVTVTTATVQLIGDRASSVAVRLSESAEVGRLEGTGRPELRLRLLNPNAIVTAGQQIVTTGESSIFPPTIPVGTISRVEPIGGNVTRIAYVKPHVDFTSLGFVLVVVDPKAADRPDPTPKPAPTVSPRPASPKPTVSPQPSHGAG